MGIRRQNVYMGKPAKFQKAKNKAASMWLHERQDGKANYVEHPEEWNRSALNKAKTPRVVMNRAAQRADLELSHRECKNAETSASSSYIKKRLRGKDCPEAHVEPQELKELDEFEK